MTRHFALLAVIAGLLGAEANAGPVTLRINATVILYSNDLGLLPFTATAGDSFYVDYTFESGTPDTDASTAIGTYDNAVLGYTAVVNGVSLSPGVSTIGNFIQVVDDFGSSDNTLDAYNLQSGAITAGQNSYALSVVMENPFQIAPVAPFTSANLPSVPWDVSAFTNRTLDVAVFTTVNGQLRSNQLSGAITSITTPTVVPAPGALWLLATGIGVLVHRRSRPRA